MSPAVAEVRADPKAETMDRTRLTSRPGRWRESALWLSVRLAPAFFALYFAISFVASWPRGAGIVGHFLGTLVSSAFAALVASGAVFVAVCQVSLMESRKTRILMERGIPVSSRLAGAPTVYGEAFARRLAGDLLGALWSRTARAIARNVPTFVVTYRFEANGEAHSAWELFYADEEVAQDPDDTAWAIVDPEAPGRRSWLVRVQGTLQGACLQEPPAGEAPSGSA